MTCGYKQGMSKGPYLHAPAKAILSGHHKRRPVVDFHEGTAALALTRLGEAPPELHP